MEIHRLKPMKEGYDIKLFNKIYKETEALRHSLVFQIDPRRYGVTRDILLSWFDDKFIFVFNKYYGTVSNDILKGNIINSLKFFKYRVLRNAYSVNNIYNDTIHIEDNDYFIKIIPSKDDIEENSELLNMAIKFLKKTLSPDAFFILELELNPPEYIMSRIDSISTKIPNNLIAEYLDLDNSYIEYLSELRKEISKATSKAKNYLTIQ